MSILDDPDFIHGSNTWPPPLPQKLDAFPSGQELLWEGHSILTAHGKQAVRKLFWGIAPFILLFLLPFLLIVSEIVHAPSIEGVYVGLFALLVFSLVCAGTLSIPMTYRSQLRNSRFGANKSYLFIQNNTKKIFAYTWATLPPITYEVNDPATITIMYSLSQETSNSLPSIILMEALEGDAQTFAQLMELQRAAQKAYEEV